MATENKKVELQAGFDASGVKTGVNEAKGAIEDLARSTEKLGNRASKGVDAVGEAVKKTGGKLGTVGDDAEKSAARVDAATKNIIASIQRATALRTSGAERGGASFFESLADLRGANRDALAPYIAQLRQAEEAQRAATNGLGKMEVSAKQTAAALRQVPAQFTDIITSLQGGQAPLTVLLQQGGQLKDTFGGIVPAARALGGFIAGLVSPLTVAGAALVGFGVAAFKGAQEQQEFVKTLILTGNAAGVTATQLTAVSAAIDKTSFGVTQSKAAEVLNEIARAGINGASSLELFTRAAIDFERAGGQAATETAKAFAELGKDPLQASIKLNDATNYLTRSTYEQIKALTEQGREVEAARVAQEAYADALNNRTPQMEANLGLLQRLWRGIKDATKEAADAALSVGRPRDVIGDQISNLEGRIANNNRELQGASPFQREAIERGNALLKERLSFLQQQAGYEATNNALVAEGARLLKLRIESDKDGLQFLTRRQKLERELAAESVRGSQLVNVGLITQEAFLARIAAIRDKFKEPAGRRDNSGEQDLDLLNKLAGLTSTYNNELETLNRLRAAGKLNEEQYGEAVRKLVAIQPFAVKASRDIADAAKAEAKAMDDAAKANDRNVDAIIKRIDAQSKDREKIQEEITRLTLGKEAEEELLRVRLLSQAAAADSDALWTAVTEEQADAYRRLADELRKTADARARLGSAIVEKDIREAASKSAKDAAAEWKRSADQIEQSLTDALLRGFESGKDFAKNFRDTVANLFRTLVLRPIIQGIVQPVAGNITNLLGLGGQTGQTGAAGALQQAQSLYGQLTSLYGTVKNYGSQALSFFGAGGASAASAGGAAASAGGGVSAGALLGDASGAAASSATAASSASYASIYAAIIVAASNAAARDFRNGFNQDSARNIGGALGPLAQTTTNLGDVLRKIGISNEAASILSGETLVSKLFGRGRANVEGRNIVGNIGADGFEGTFDTRTRERGGVFRSDRVTTTSEALGGDIDRAIDETTAKLREQAKKYGAALGLPVEAIDSVVRAFNVDVTFADQEEAIKRIQAELAQYGDSLLETFAPALDSVKNLGETTAQTIERVAGNLLSVNEVLKSIGVASISTSVAGGTAALALQDLFGGLQGLQTAAGAYFNEFFTAEQKQEQLRKQLTTSFAEINQALPTTRAGFKALVESQDLTTESGRKTFTTLLAVSGAFAELVPALESTAKSARELAAEGLQKQLDDINKAVGDFGVLDVSTTLSEKLTEGRSALEALQTGLASAMGGLSKTILDQLNDLIASQRALQEFRGGLQGNIASARLAGLSRTDRIAELRSTEANLFQDLGRASDPVAVAIQLQQVIIQRIQEETSLRQEAADAVEKQIKDQRDLQIDGLRTQITAFGRLQDIARDVLDFTSGLRSSDISPLSFEARLAETRRQFEASFTGARAGDVGAASSLTGDAKAYLDQARAYFGSSAAYADIFAQVTGSLDQLAGTAPTDPQIKALQDQADALAALNATQGKTVEANVGLAAALTSLDGFLANREANNQKEIDARAKEVQAQIERQQETNGLLEAQILQAREGYGRLEEELMRLNGQVARLVGNADLAVAEPS